MRAEEVREVVRITINELMSANMIKAPVNDDTIIYDFFEGGEDSGVCQALHELSDDKYIDVIYLYYRDSKTLEWIAEYMNRDVSTIKRNKRRLVRKVNEIVRGLYG